MILGGKPMSNGSLWKARSISYIHSTSYSGISSSRDQLVHTIETTGLTLAATYNITPKWTYYKWMPFAIYRNIDERERSPFHREERWNSSYATYQQPLGPPASSSNTTRQHLSSLPIIASLAVHGPGLVYWLITLPICLRASPLYCVCHIYRNMD